MSESYNGWSNYETWCVFFELTEDPEVLRQARSCIGSGHALRQLVLGMLGVESRAGNLSNMLLMAALDRVDWREILESLSKDESEQENDQ